MMSITTTACFMDVQWDEGSEGTAEEKLNCHLKYENGEAMPLSLQYCDGMVSNPSRLLFHHDGR
jgi:hypothetical protein